MRPESLHAINIQVSDVSLIMKYSRAHWVMSTETTVKIVELIIENETLHKLQAYETRGAFQTLCQKLRPPWIQMHMHHGDCSLLGDGLHQRRSQVYKYGKSITYDAKNTAVTNSLCRECSRFSLSVVISDQQRAIAGLLLLPIYSEKQPPIWRHAKTTCQSAARLYKSTVTSWLHLTIAP